MYAGHSVLMVRHIARSAASAAVMLTLCACSPLDVLNVISVRPQLDGDANIAFQNPTDLRLDVYRARGEPGTRDAAHPVIVFFYGGAWKAGSKDKYRFVASRLTREGFVVVLPDYRLFPDVSFPAFVEDGADAVTWVFDNIDRYGGAPGNVFVMGHSAGAHIAALLHYDERYLEDAGATRNTCGFIGLAGPYDFLPLVSEELKRVFPEETREQSQPVNFVDGSEAPALLIHGLKDNRVKPRNSGSLEKAAKENGAQAELVVYDERGHVGVLLALSRPFGYLAPVVEQVSRFVEQTGC